MLVFISHSNADEHHADQLEKAMRPGGFRAWRFQSDMVCAKPWDPQLPANIEECAIFLLATTENSLDSKTCEREWQHAALKQKPFVPVVLNGVYPPSPINDLQCVLFDDSAASGAQLISALQNAQPLPWETIPGHWKTWEGKAKSNLSKAQENHSDIPLPKLNRELTDMEKEDFLYKSLGEIRSYFERALNAFGESDSRVQIQIRNKSDSAFSFQIYFNGNVKKGCRIWIYNQYGLNGIAFHESDGRTAFFGKHPYDELAKVAELDGNPALEFTLNLVMFNQFNGCQICTVDKAAECLWRYFTRGFGQDTSHW